MGQARPLIGHDQAEALAKMIVAKGLSARQVEALAKQPAGNAGQKPKPPAKSADIKALEKQAAEKLGLAFHIDWNETKDRGKVTIDCQSLDQMTNLLAQLGIR
jgi:ParB family chromosome partitioning protein